MSGHKASMNAPCLWLRPLPTAR